MLKDLQEKCDYHRESKERQKSTKLLNLKNTISEKKKKSLGLAEDDTFKRKVVSVVTNFQGFSLLSHQY